MEPPSTCQAVTTPPYPVREQIRRLERLREEAPGSLAFVRLAEAYRSAGESDLALRVLNEGRADAPEHPAIHLVAARIHHDRGQAGEERAALRRALELDPENEVAGKALQRLDDAAGESGGSDLDAGSHVRRASHSPEERAELLEQLGGVAGSDWWEEDQGRDGTEGPPDGTGADHGPVTETMARLYARQGLWEEAETVYERLLEARPDDTRLARGLEAVRSQEVPPDPGGEETTQDRPTTGGARGTDETARGTEAGGSTVGRRDATPGDGPPTMRRHLRALLRGGGARPVRRDSRSGPTESASERPAPESGRGRRRAETREEAPEEDRRAGEHGSEGEMEELLRRWQRAARRGREE